MSTERADEHPDFKLSSTSLPDQDLKPIKKPTLHYVYAYMDLRKLYLSGSARA